MIPPAMTEATKKASSRIQDVSEDEATADEVEVVPSSFSFFLSIEAGKRDVSSSAGREEEELLPLVVVMMAQLTII